MNDFLNNEQKLLLKLIGHVWTCIYAIDRLEIGESPNLSLDRLENTACLLEQMAMLLRNRVAEQRPAAGIGSTPLPKDSACEGGPYLRKCQKCGAYFYSSMDRCDTCHTSSRPDSTAAEETAPRPKVT